MTSEELLQKEVIKIKDIQAAYECSYNTAANVIKAIRAYSDRLNICGVVHRLDYQEYMEAKSKARKSAEV